MFLKEIILRLLRGAAQNVRSVLVSRAGWWMRGDEPRALARWLGSSREGISVDREQGERRGLKKALYPIASANLLWAELVDLILANGRRLIIKYPTWAWSLFHICGHGLNPLWPISTEEGVNLKTDWLAISYSCLFIMFSKKINSFPAHVSGWLQTAELKKILFTISVR